MAGNKRAAKGAKASRSSSRRTRGSAGIDAVPDVYRQMLSEAQVRPNVESSEPPRKRRKPGEKTADVRPATVSNAHNKTGDEVEEEEEEEVQFEDVGIPVPTVQTMYRDSDEETDEEDDDSPELEDVDFSFLKSLDNGQVEEAPKTIQLDFSAHASTTPRQTVERRKPLNRLEKDRRVEIHKTHLLCLLSHVSRRNRWCNDSAVQDALRKLLSSKTIAYLNPGTHLSQFGQTESLKNGLQQAETAFKTKFQVTERGSRRALWADTEERLQNYKIPDDAESTLDRSDFRDAARTLKGSRDVGAQLYCALLRSVGVEARLVCSLQPLSFASGGPTMASTPKSKQKLSLEEQYARRPKYDSSFESPGVTLSPSARRRLGHPNAAAFELPSISPAAPSRPPQDTTRKIRESQFPIYWVEVLDVAHQKWQPVDPLVTQSFWKPRLFEPPANERENCMTYAVGFEADGTAKDVTRRYAKAYNAKTRKMRIESVMPSGDRWWRKAMRAFGRGYATDLDQIENNELLAMEAREPMPRNVADFKDHPIYALERHMRRHEVLTPGASASGTVGAGSKGALERIYRRADVRIARTRERWYRLGREVRADEIPVKFLPKPAKRATDGFGDADDDLDDGDTAGTPIFTTEQTDLYQAPPVVNGKIPKNRYGNLDIYVPSMVPAGGAYIADEYGAQAAYTLGIDYAPALTGFQFKGRKGTAVLFGVVVPAENEEAVRAVISSLRDLEADIERERRTREVLRTWKRFLMNLRIRQRIFDGIDSDDGRAEDDQRDPDKGKGLAVENNDEDDESELSEMDEELEGGFIVEDDEYGGGF